MALRFDGKALRPGTYRRRAERGLCRRAWSRAEKGGAPMSTRSVIARVGEHEGQFSGRYVHADGYPTGMGAFLWNALHGHFKNDLGKMLVYLIDASHAQYGWSALLGKDFTLK